MFARQRLDVGRKRHPCSTSLADEISVNDTINLFASDTTQAAAHKTLLASAWDRPDLLDGIDWNLPRRIDIAGIESLLSLNVLPSIHCFEKLRRMGDSKRMLRCGRSITCRCPMRRSLRVIRHSTSQLVWARPGCGQGKHRGRRAGEARLAFAHP